MVRSDALGPGNRRRAIYSYLRPLFEGRRVLEVGCGGGEGLGHLLALGAQAVVGAERDPVEREEARRRVPQARLLGGETPALRDVGPFEVVVVPEAAGLFAGSTEPSLATLRSLLGPQGRLVCVLPSGERAASGVAYFTVVDALTPHFPTVRMFGQTPFLALGLAEFDEAAAGLRVDTALVDPAAEQPTHYVAVAGPDEGLALGYALVQLPLVEGSPDAAPAETAELRRLLAAAQGQAEGALRVSRAQTEEIEELRARLRRAAEARAELDAEVSRLRRALTDADESVMSITRRTTEEMTSLAQRLTAGLRAEGPPAGALAERLRAQEAAIAERESALSERDERVAVLEAEKQDLVWRIEAAEEQLRRAAAFEAPAPTGPGLVPEELLTSLRAREQALEEYRRAAQAHVDEVVRLREALTDQATLVAELEEALAGAEARLRTAEAEAARLREALAETEKSDRQRRSRLAELEGSLLRMQRLAEAERARAAEAVRASAGVGEPPADAQRRIQELSGRISDLETENRGLHARLEEAERQGGDVERRWGDAADRIVGLERVAAEVEERAQSEEALRARIADLESRADDGRLSGALAEVDRLRGALQRSEEQLWEARGRLLADRARWEAIERGTGSSEGGPQAKAAVDLLAQVVTELDALEDELRAEAAQLGTLERLLADWRNGTGREAAGHDAPSPPTES